MTYDGKLYLENHRYCLDFFRYVQENASTLELFY